MTVTLTAGQWEVIRDAAEEWATDQALRACKEDCPHRVCQSRVENSAAISKAIHDVEAGTLPEGAE